MDKDFQLPHGSLGNMSVLALLRLLMTEARELFRRLDTQRLQEEDGSYQGFDDTGFGLGGQSHHVPSQPVHHPARCGGTCCICGIACVRLEPGHKHCQRKRHLHCR